MPAPRILNRHVVTGTMLLAVGGVGLTRFWDSLGLVSRGLVPFGLLGGGFVMVGAGVQTMRRRDTNSARRSSLAPLFTALIGIALIIAAVGGSELSQMVLSWTLYEVVGYLTLGFVAGVVGGMLGLGGGLVHLSGLLFLFGLPFPFARGATLINNVFINAAAAVRYGRKGFIFLPAVIVLLPLALVGVTLGSLFQEGLDGATLSRILAVFVVFLTIAIVFDTFRAVNTSAKPQAEQQLLPLGLTGVLAGFLSGVLGISGGVVVVPGQTLWSRLNLRHAIANSTLVTAVSSGLGSLLLLAADTGPTLSATEMATIAILFVPGNLIGGHLGAYWMERLSTTTVRICFIAMLLLIAAKSWGVF